jgi:hypothetical protein
MRIQTARRENLYGFYIARCSNCPRIYMQAQPSSAPHERRSSMMDAIMLGFGAAMFLCFLGYTALCESL